MCIIINIKKKILYTINFVIKYNINIPNKKFGYRLRVIISSSTKLKKTENINFKYKFMIIYY